MSKVIKSDTVTINRPAADIFNYITDFKNFGRMMPEQVANYQAETDACSFEIKGMASLGLRITEKHPFTRVVMNAEGKLPFGFTFTCNTDAVSENSTEVVLVIDADMNPFMTMMAATPLQNFVNLLAGKLKEIMESAA